jgi:hypothetical protein
LFDAGGAWGSASRLQGLTIYPLANFFDAASEHFQHELGHQWINFLDVAPFSAALPHWPISTMASGTMGWSEPGQQGLTIPCLIEPSGSGIKLSAKPAGYAPEFNDLDLYLMGAHAREWRE